jgi:hypothetical protein
MNYTMLLKAYTVDIISSSTPAFKEGRVAYAVQGLSYWLDDRVLAVLFPVGAREFSVLHEVQTDYRAHPASYTMDTWGCFPGGKVAGE